MLPTRFNKLFDRNKYVLLSKWLSSKLLQPVCNKVEYYTGTYEMHFFYKIFNYCLKNNNNKLSTYNRNYYEMIIRLMAIRNN